MIRKRNLSIDEDEENKCPPQQITRKSIYDQVGATVGDIQGDIGLQEYFLIFTTEGLTLLNEGKVSKEGKYDFSFMQRIIEFAMDNCATFHVCKDKFLFIGTIKKCPNIKVKGVSGIATASGIGTIRFMITSKTGENEEIVLHNVIYLPESPKNLISISRWSRDRGDDCGILSRGDI